MSRKWGIVIFILAVIIIFLALGYIWLISMFRPVNAFSIDMDHELADRSFLTSKPCSPPCWYNLELGKSTIQDVNNVLEQLPFVVEGSIVHQEDANDLNEERVWYKCPYFEGPTCGSITLRNGIVEDINLVIAYELSVEDVIQKIGPPEYVEYHLGGHSECLILLNYPQERMAFDIYFDNDTEGYCRSFFGKGQLDLSLQIKGLSFNSEQSFVPCGTYDIPCFPWDYVETDEEISRPPALDCESFSIAEYSSTDITDLQIDSAGSIWVSTYGEGVFEYIPESKALNHYTPSDGLADDSVRSIAISQQGEVWLGIDGGLSRFDGNSWQSWTTEDGLVHENIYSIDFDSNGIVWIGTQGGVSSFDPSTEVWTNFSVEDGLPDEFFHLVRVTPDDHIWFDTSLHGVIRFIPTSSGQYEWEILSSYLEKIEVIPIFRFEEIKVDEDGVYWFASNILTRYDPNTKLWEKYNNAYIGSIEDFEFAEDGTLWMAPYTHEPGLILWLSPGEQIEIQDLLFFDSNDGLPRQPESVTNHDPIEEIEIASDGTIWVATNKFVAHCSIPSD